MKTATTLRAIVSMKRCGEDRQEFVTIYIYILFVINEMTVVQSVHSLSMRITSLDSVNVNGHAGISFIYV